MGPPREAASFLAAHFSPDLQGQEPLSSAQGCMPLWPWDCLPRVLFGWDPQDSLLGWEEGQT